MSKLQNKYKFEIDVQVDSLNFLNSRISNKFFKTKKFNDNRYLYNKKLIWQHVHNDSISNYILEIKILKEIWLPKKNAS